MSKLLQIVVGLLIACYASYVLVEGGRFLVRQERKMEEKLWRLHR